MPEPTASGFPTRPPRAFAVHWLVDAAIAFLAVVVVALFWGVPLVPLAIGALVVGLLAAPFTRRAEIRGLAAREAAGRAGGDDDGNGDGPVGSPDRPGREEPR